MIAPDTMPPADQDVYWIIVDENQVVDTAADNEAFAPPLAKASEIPFADQAYTAKIGESDGIDVFLLVRQDYMPMLETWQLRPLRQCLLRTSLEWFGIAARGMQITGFLRTHKYCGACGNETAQDRDELAVVCGHCGLISYPRISPCIIVAIYRGNEILLARGVRHPEGIFSLLAGFVESGESLEGALHREVFEEAGIRVKNLEYMFSQPWPFPHSLMAGFIAEYDSGELILAPDELIEGGWYAMDALPRIPPSGTIAARLIRALQSRIQDQN